MPAGRQRPCAGRALSSFDFVGLLLLCFYILICTAFCTCSMHALSRADMVYPFLFCQAAKCACELHTYSESVHGGICVTTILTPLCPIDFAMFKRTMSGQTQTAFRVGVEPAQFSDHALDRSYPRRGQSSAGLLCSTTCSTSTLLSVAAAGCQEASEQVRRPNWPITP